MSLATTAHIHTEKTYLVNAADGSKKNPKEPDFNPEHNRLSAQDDVMIAGSFNPGPLPTTATIP